MVRSMSFSECVSNHDNTRFPAIKVVGFASVKISPRIVVPITLALALGLLAGAIFLWQIHTSILTIESSFQTRRNDTNLLQKLLPSGKNRLPVENANLPEAMLELRQGEVFELKGEWKKAQEHYQKSVQSGGGAPALRKLASIELQRREYDSAKRTIGTLSEQSPKSSDVVLLQGLLALRSGDTRGAAAIFSRSPESSESQYGAALVAISQGDHEAAKKALTLAIAGDSVSVRTNAKILLAAYEEFALFPNGQDTHLLTLVARALAQVNECETALPLLQTVILKQERYRDAWIVKGFCEFTSERLKDALTSLEEAYSLDPEKAETQYFLARTHAALGDPQNAATFLQYAILNGFEPQRDARELLIQYAKELGDTDLALEQLKIFANDRDSDLGMYANYVNLAIASPNHGTGALDLARKAMAKWPNDAGALALGAKAAFAAGEKEDAEKYLANALRLDPRNPKVIEAQEMMRKTK